MCKYSRIKNPHYLFFLKSSNDLAATLWHFFSMKNLVFFRFLLNWKQVPLSKGSSVFRSLNLTEKHWIHALITWKCYTCKLQYGMAPYCFPNKAQRKCLTGILKYSLLVPKNGSAGEEFFFWWWSKRKEWKWEHSSIPTSVKRMNPNMPF